MPASRETRTLLLVILAAAAVAVVSARPYAGAWNDGSRLATVECLVDHGTLAIDDSLFVRVPPDGSAQRNPYPASQIPRQALFLDKYAQSIRQPRYYSRCLP